MRSVPPTVPFGRLVDKHYRRTGGNLASQTSSGSYWNLVGCPSIGHGTYVYERCPSTSEAEDEDACGGDPTINGAKFGMIYSDVSWLRSEDS
jgi:hypothetical protein